MRSRVPRGHVVTGLVGVLALAAASADAGPLVLVRDGAPAATIVVAAAAGDKVKSAARELQDYIAKLSGATLPLIFDLLREEGDEHCRSHDRVGQQRRVGVALHAELEQASR